MANEKPKMKAMLLFEIIGRPPEHLTEALKGIIMQMGSENGIKVKENKIAEPKKMEQKTGMTTPEGGIQENEFYSSFAEVEIEADDLLSLTTLMFKYMPAHVEIISPENITLSNGNWSEILSELIRRLHGYDEVARVLQVEKTVLENKLRSLINSGIRVVPTAKTSGEKKAGKAQSKKKETKAKSKKK